jgi:hypothetical protein
MEKLLRTLYVTDALQDTIVTGELETYDDTILLNADTSVDADGGVEIYRPVAGSNATLLWNETSDKWECGVSGSTVEICDVSSSQVLSNKTSYNGVPINSYYTDAIAIGDGAGLTDHDIGCIAIGKNAGKYQQIENAIAIGKSAGQTSQDESAIAIGVDAGSYIQGNDSVALGKSAGQTNQGSLCIAIGSSAGAISQQMGAIAIGYEAGQTNQAEDCVAIGQYAGQGTQGTGSVAIGLYSGQISQGDDCVSIARYAGQQGQASGSIAIGNFAGQTGQGGIAIGSYAGRQSQGVGAIALGSSTGRTNQGSYSIAIGDSAGKTSQHANSIILNASGSALNSDGTSRCYVDPIRNASNSQALYYNTATKEITYDTATGGGEVTLAGVESLSNKTLVAPTMGNDSILDPNGNEIITFAYEASAVNNFKISNKSATNGVILEAIGGDTNISLHLRPKGTSQVTIQDGTDNTKFLKFNVSGITTGTTRTWTFADTNDTFVGTTSTQTLTNKVLTNPTFTSSSSAPSPSTSMVYFDTTLNRMGYYNGTIWVYPGLFQQIANVSVHSLGTSASQAPSGNWTSSANNVEFYNFSTSSQMGHIAVMFDSSNSSNTSNGGWIGYNFGSQTAGIYRLSFQALYREVCAIMSVQETTNSVTIASGIDMYRPILNSSFNAGTFIYEWVHPATSVINIRWRNAGGRNISATQYYFYLANSFQLNRVG